jgi:TFIIF-interacting CTD phosphatase-like protein
MSIDIKSMSFGKKKENEKFIFVLDLDETLINSATTKEREALKKTPNFTSHEMIGSDYIIYERPGLQKFLDFLFANFTVCVWTAASKDYASFIVKNIVLNSRKERKLDWFFFDYHCELSKRISNTKSTKDLDVLCDIFKLQGYTNTNVVIIDDNKNVYQAQPGKCINIKEFKVAEGNSETDNELLKLIPLIKKIKSKMGNKSFSGPANFINHELVVTSV